MLFSGRAYYNLLLLQKLRCSEESCTWENIDYREVSSEQLLEKLEQFGIELTLPSFLLYAKDFDTPEQLVEELNEEIKEKVYLIFFELWRRHLNEKETVSIFCDELDRKISAYEKDKDDELLFSFLKKTVEILDRNVEFGCESKDVFEKFSMYVAHDLEHVIFTYIATIAKKNKENEANDLIECFTPYVKDRRIMQFLRLKVMHEVFEEEKEKLSLFLLSSLQEKTNTSLSICLLFYYIEKTDQEKFSELFSYLVNDTQKETDLLRLLDVLNAYQGKFSNYCQEDELKKIIKSLSAKRKRSMKSHKKNILSLL